MRTAAPAIWVRGPAPLTSVRERRFGTRRVSRTRRATRAPSSDRLGLRRLGFLRILERELHLAGVVDVDRHVPASHEPAEEKLVGERLADRVLDEPRHRTRAHLRIEALSREELFELRRERRIDLLLVQLVLEVEQELVDDAQDHVVVELRERDRRIEPVAELGCEEPLDL